MEAITLAVVLLAGGLAAGVLAGTLLGGVPLLLSLPPERYVAAHAFFASRYDPFMPICFLVAIVGDLALIVLLDPVVARVLAGLAAGLATCGAVVSVARNVPVNRWIRSLDPEHLPADFPRHDPRRHWAWWNRWRSIAAIVAFVLNCLVVVLR